MQYVLTINCDNAAFDEPGPELARLLKQSAIHVDGPVGVGFYQPLRDINGNKCGEARIVAMPLLDAAQNALMQFEHNGDESPEDRTVLDELQAAIGEHATR